MFQPQQVGGDRARRDGNNERRGDGTEAEEVLELDRKRVHVARGEVSIRDLEV